MKLNAKTALISPKVLLVPYEPHHVPTYHAWMEDEELRKATASERLTLEEEYNMQQKWRLDADKLTYIVCLPPKREVPADGCILPTQDDASDRMVGDVNLFLADDDAESEQGQRRVVGEVELMVAKKECRGKGLGRASLVSFLHYVLRNQEEIVKERFGSSDVSDKAPPPTLSALRVKINKDNTPSIKLFEGVGFVKKSDTPNYFGEFELVLQKMDIVNIGSLMKCCGLDGWKAASYEGTPYAALRGMCNLF